MSILNRPTLVNQRASVRHRTSYVKTEEWEMRVLFTVPPALSHLFPLVPLAWALRAAGHELLVATSSSAVPAAVSAGLPAVDVAPTVDFDEVFGVGKGTVGDRVAEHRRRGEAIAQAGGAATDAVLERFAHVTDLMADGVVRAAEEMRPDLVVHGRLQGAGLLVARKLQVPAVEHGVGFVREGDLAERYLPHLAGVFARHGVPAELPARTSVQIAPPELMIGEGEAWNVRFVPYSGGGVLPTWVTKSRSRPRIVVTLGTVLPKVVGVGGLEKVLKGAASTDAEFVVIGADAQALGDVAPNVRTADWCPLAGLLQYSDAIIHHGGAGSTLTSIDAGLPQLALPYGADEFVNAGVIVRHGFGLSADANTVDDELISRLMTNSTLRESAGRARRQMRCRPAPAQLVGALTALAG
ncbi:nucleotide disphospho-sugar-binding domain-containing protein [Micromonospora sp. LOL_023]|uniref:nucleotide disphospho-sugar-binding domain-containing protein n=1 Tax=Micromonospora sp. LOL_023 TaxID=3345418 RepID=UPI003A8BEEE3